jgi:two-component system uhpT operon response regulator UhpA
MTRLAIADDHAIVRKGLRSLLEQAGGFDIVAECSDIAGAREAVERLRPDVLVTDISMPGGNGLQLAGILRTACPDLKILLYSQYASPMYVTEARRLGLAGYVSKDVVADELLDALASVVRGEFYLSSDLRAQAEIAGLDALSEQERRIFLLLAEGLAPKQVAAEVGIKDKTVYAHREHIREKLGLRSDAQLQLLARRIGLLR